MHSRIDLPIDASSSRSQSDEPRHQEDQHDDNWCDQTFGEMLRQSATVFPLSCALVDGERQLTYQQLDQRVDRLASGLAHLGLSAGDKVLLQLPNSIEFVVVCFALYRLGVQPILALPAHRDVELASFCAFAEVSAYICVDQHEGCDFEALALRLQQRFPKLEHVIVSGKTTAYCSLQSLYQTPYEPKDVNGTLPTPEMIACFQLSGGTTGVPKLIPRRHGEYLYNLKTCADICRFSSETVYLAALPMAHNFTMCCPGFMGTLYAGGCVVVAHQPTAEHCFPLIERYQVTHTALVPPLVLLWMEAVKLGSKPPYALQWLQVGGARLSYEVARRVSPVLGCQLQQVFGMAEGLICMTRPDDEPSRVLHTQGRPISTADEIRVVDEKGLCLPSGQVGQLQTRGPYTIQGYYRNPQANASAFTADGFYCSGDRVSLTRDGDVIVEGRDKDLINRGGEKIAAEEVENLLLSHPAVIDVALVAMPDEFLGERACAFVLTREAVSAMALKRHLSQQGVAAFKLPDRFQFIDEFPSTGVGKVSRQHLRAVLQQQLLSSLEPAIPISS